MNASSTPSAPAQTALQQRDLDRQRQLRWFGFTLPIALLIHLGAIVGLSIWLRQIEKVAKNPIEEVEIIADSSQPTENKPDLSQSIDPNGEGGDLAGGGGASSRFALFQGNGGTADGNNVVALGNPFASSSDSTEAESNPIAPTSDQTTSDQANSTEINPAETTPADTTQDVNIEDPSVTKPIENKSSVHKPNANKPNANKPNANQSNANSKLGEFNGKKNGEGIKGDRNHGQLDVNAPKGSGKSGVVGPGTQSSGAAGDGNKIGNRVGKPGQKPIAKPTESQPSEPKPKVQNQVPSAPIAIVPSTSTPQKKPPKCIENCSLDGYLGAEGTLRITREIDKDGNVIPKLLQSSGDPELDRKALEVISRQRYETSENGHTGTVRVTSQQEGSDFARQQEDRRRQDQAERAAAERAAIDRERALQEQERPKAEQSPAEPIEKPIEKPIVEPPVEPIRQPESTSITEPIEKPTEPVAEPIAVPVAEPAPAPVVEPVIEPVAEPTLPEPILEPSQLEPTHPEPASTPKTP